MALKKKASDGCLNDRFLLNLKVEMYLQLKNRSPKNGKFCLNKTAERGQSADLQRVAVFFLKKKKKKPSTITFLLQTGRRSAQIGSVT